VWQALHEELRDRNFVVIAVALDKSAEDARPWIEKAAPTYPVLIDTQHVLPDLYNIVNVPTALWIDERGRIVRPNDVVFGTDTFKHITNLESAKPLAAVRTWVRGETAGFAPADADPRHRSHGSAVPRDAADVGRRRPPVLSPAPRHAWLGRCSSCVRPTPAAA